MLLGEMLVHEGLIRAEQLEAALAAQVVSGGRLGTNLVEIGAIGLDTLASALSRQRGVPATLQSHFAAIDPEVAKALRPVAAARHLAVPIAYANKARTQIIVAFADPHKLSSVDEVAFAISARVQPWIAPELRLLYNLERLYGLRRPNRFVRIDATRTSSPDPIVAPTAPAGGAERRRYVEPDPSLVDAAPSAPAGDTSAPAGNTSAPDRNASAREFVPSARDFVPSARDFAPSARDFVPSATPDVAGERPLETGRDSVINPSFESPAPATDVGAARLRIASAETRDEIADALVDYVRTAFGHGLVLIVRDSMALGWRGTGPDADEGSIAVSLDAPTLLSAAFRSDGSFVRGAPPAEGAVLHARLAMRLGDAAAPRDAVVASIAIRRRVVNLVYAHARGGGPLRDDAVAGLSALCDDAAAAYTRLLQRARTEKVAETADSTQKRKGWKKPAG